MEIIPQNQKEKETMSHSSINSEEEIGRKVADAQLKINAVKLQPEKPFTWASGWKSPIYCDNREFFWYPEYRKTITRCLVNTIYRLGLKPTFIAGVSTSGIPWGSWVADEMKLPMVYVRPEPKSHGLENQIEGIGSRTLDGELGILIEDLISTGGSSVKAVAVLQKAKAKVIHCVSVFSYEFPNSKKVFAGEVPYKDDLQLEIPCPLTSLLYYPQLLQVAIDSGYIEEKHRAVLEKWAKDPAKWGENHGF